MVSSIASHEGAAGVTLTLSVGSATDVGLRRKANEDSYVTGFPMFAVADGMGGHDAGDKASQAVIAQLSAVVGVAGITPEDVADAIDAAHGSVRLVAQGKPRGAGSTLTGAAVIFQEERPHWLIFNIGDSRVYRLRGTILSQLTVDHSIAQELVDEGKLAREDVATYQGRNVITKAVGADYSDADFWLYPVVSGEKLLLCSDGLSGEVTDDALVQTLTTQHDVQDAADALIRQALDAGGRDNVTVVIVEVVEGGLDSEIDEETGVIRARLGADDEDLEANTVEIPERVKSDG